MRKSTTKWFGMLLVIVFAGASYASSPLMKLEYFYAKDGTLIGRAINGARQNYEYDRRGQLLAVKDANGKDVERYIYDPVGNILSKTVTGKPHIGELGYAFLFRNYRPEQGKWQTADPLGYPDGWNNLAYVNNRVFLFIDWLGAASAFVQGREVNNTFGLFSHLSLHYTVTPSEYAQLTPAQQAFFHASPGQFLPGEGQVYWGHISGFPSNNLPALTGAYLAIDPLNASDGLGETEYIGTVTPQGSSSQFDMLKNILNAAIAFQNNQTGTDYDWFPNDQDEGNSNSLIGNLILNGGGIAPQNIPTNAVGFSHVMGRQFYE